MTNLTAPGTMSTETSTRFAIKYRPTASTPQPWMYRTCLTLAEAEQHLTSCRAAHPEAVEFFLEMLISTEQALTLKIITA